MALVMSPLWRMPPSAMIGTPADSATLTAEKIAVICGTPTPLMIRVVQMRRGRCPPSPHPRPRRSNPFAPSAVATFPAITWMFQFFLISRTVSMHILAVAMSGIDDDDIHIRLDERFDAGEILHAGGGADPKAAALVFAGVGELVQLVQVAHGDQARQRPSLSISKSFSTLAL